MKKQRPKIKRAQNKGSKISSKQPEKQPVPTAEPVIQPSESATKHATSDQSQQRNDISVLVGRRLQSG
jgi:hypothetical protein